MDFNAFSFQFFVALGLQKIESELYCRIKEMIAYKMMAEHKMAEQGSIKDQLNVIYERLKEGSERKEELVVIMAETKRITDIIEQKLNNIEAEDVLEKLKKINYEIYEWNKDTTVRDLVCLYMSYIRMDKTKGRRLLKAGYILQRIAPNLSYYNPSLSNWVCLVRATAQERYEKETGTKPINKYMKEEKLGNIGEELSNDD